MPILLTKFHPKWYPFSFNIDISQQPRRRVITFEFGKHNDIYFGNLEGHKSLNPLKMKLYISGFEKNDVQGVPKNF